MTQKDSGCGAFAVSYQGKSLENDSENPDESSNTTANTTANAAAVTQNPKSKKTCICELEHQF